MPGTMSQADLVADLKASLQDAAAPFVAAADADYKRHLAAAALDFGRKRRRTMVGALALVAGQPAYAAPADLLGVKSHLWGIEPIEAPKPWESGYPGPLPDLALIEEGGVRKLRLSRAPTAAQIAALGAELRYWYHAGHVIAEVAANTTLLDGERALLLLRGQAEAMRELAFRGIAKPVQLRDGMGSMPRNGMPGHLFQQLMDEFEAA